MNDGHLSDGIRNNNCDDCTEKIREDDGWAGEANCEGTAEEESHSDRAADRHHGELA
jgi:hypothetical protein